MHIRMPKFKLAHSGSGKEEGNFLFSSYLNIYLLVLILHNNKKNENQIKILNSKINRNILKKEEEEEELIDIDLIKA